MKELPDEKNLLELLELAKEAARKAREMNDLAIAIEEKYEKRVCEFREGAAKQEAGVSE